jgi:type III secretion system FlhB-like substrate exporter
MEAPKVENQGKAEKAEKPVIELAKEEPLKIDQN